MIIKIVAVSNIKEKYIQEGIDEYLKRLNSYTTIKIKEVDAQKVKSSMPIERIKDLEADKIRQTITDKSYLIVLDEHGKQLTSEGLADYLKNSLLTSGKTQLDFVIGGANGLSESIIKQADYVWSLSKLTFPHQLVRLILLEQLYRSFRIMNNEPYHK